VHCICMMENMWVGHTEAATKRTNVINMYSAPNNKNIPLHTLQTRFFLLVTTMP